MRAPAIRDATAADAISLVELLAQLGYPTSADALRVKQTRLLATPGERALVAEAGGRLVGLATIHIFELIYRQRPVWASRVEQPDQRSPRCNFRGAPARVEELTMGLAEGARILKVPLRAAGLHTVAFLSHIWPVMPCDTVGEFLGCPAESRRSIVARSILESRNEGREALRWSPRLARQATSRGRTFKSR